MGYNYGMNPLLKEILIELAEEAGNVVKDILCDVADYLIK
jgi:hypothetical protein